jgi:hypothetical protein
MGVGGSASLVGVWRAGVVNSGVADGEIVAGVSNTGELQAYIIKLLRKRRTKPGILLVSGGNIEIIHKSTSI